MKIFIGITQYNRSCFLREQIARINRYLLMAREDILTIAIADNSTNEADRKVNELLCNELGLFYMDCDFKERDPSLHHSMALNVLYEKSIVDQNDFTLFFDHDTFMFNASNIVYDSRDKHFAGIGQAKLGKQYLHPNVCLINNKFVPKEIVNFTPCEGMDTGGRLSDYISNIEHKQINHLSFEYGACSYGLINDVYEIIDNSFFHMIKGSNWNGNKYGQERQEALLKILQEISK